MAVAWEDHIDDVDFEVMSSVDGADWVSVALCDDGETGDGDVAVASSSADATTLFYWYTDAGEAVAVEVSSIIV